MSDATAIAATDPATGNVRAPGDAVARADAYPHEHQFDNLAQQTDAARLGMWLFLATEVLFFGGLFGAYTAYRYVYYHAFAEASRELSVLFGTLDTAVLLTSSLTMALAVFTAQSTADSPAARRRSGRTIALLLLATAALGAGFLVLHGFEYYEDYQEHHFPGRTFFFPGAESGQVELFFIIYFCLTGLHSLHVLIGVVLLAVMAALSWKGRYYGGYHNPIEISGLYWHFVDMVWVFLFPLLYLIAPR
ncbi:MAG: cytochrome c oxidase subunit 3 [Verrucomicrobia bacterium]|nr:cytochrome c oxidase subunit 3 [Verrucomicrobiota bacterium]